MSPMMAGRRLCVNLPVWVCMLSLPLTVLGGRVVNVPADRTLSSALSTAQANDEIIIAPGTYTLTAYPSISAAGVTVRGATGNPADVIVQGLGMNVDPGGATKEGFNLYANDITIKDLTVQEFFNHAIHFGVNIYRPKIINVITRNNGEQHIKGAKYNYDGLIENTICEQTYVRTNDGGVTRPDDYVGGIDLHGGSTFVIRDCIVRNIMGAGGDADGSIFAWNQSSNITVERCMVTGGNRAICFGNNSGGSLGYDVDGGIIRNCFVYARTGAPTNPNEPWTGNADIGIDLAYVRNVRVYNNTVWTNSGTYGRTIQIYDKNPPRLNENLTLAYNIWRGNLNDLATGPFTLTGNITGNTPQASWFFDAANANYHLTKLATAAIDHAVLLADVPTDFDQQTRPIGSLPDVGADEYVAADITGDGHVDVADLLIMVGSWGTQLGQPGYNAAADLKASNAIDVSDLLILAGSWGL